jgi:putative transcriptional regulator
MKQPTPDEIKAARAEAGLTQTKAAEVIYCTLRGWQDWEGGQRKMDLAKWELFLIKTGQMKCNEY